MSFSVQLNIEKEQQHIRKREQFCFIQERVYSDLCMCLYELVYVAFAVMTIVLFGMLLAPGALNVEG